MSAGWTRDGDLEGLVALALVEPTLGDEVQLVVAARNTAAARRVGVSTM